MTEPALYWAALGLLGLCLGSFVTTAAIRATRGEGFLSGRSHCDGCNASLDFAATLPVISYLGRRGAARCCGQPIDSMHPSGELAGLAIILASATLQQPVPMVLVAALGLLLLALAVFDLKTQRLPDALTAAVAFLSLAFSVLDGTASLVAGLIAAILSFIILEGVRRGYLKFRGSSGLGGGDVKLLAALGAMAGDADSSRSRFGVHARPAAGPAAASPIQADRIWPGYRPLRVRWWVRVASFSWALGDGVHRTFPRSRQTRAGPGRD